MTEQPEQPRLTIIEELLLDDRLPAEDLLDEDAIRAVRPAPKPPVKRTRTRTREGASRG